MNRLLAASIGLLLGLPLLAGTALTGLLTGLHPTPTTTATATAGAVPPGVAVPAGGLAGVPAGYLRLYRQAAAGCPGLGWPVLAAIGTIESGNGANDGPSTAGAIGPMQFEPATFASYAQPIPPGGARPASPWDPVDAVYAAARDLCANGAGRPAGLPAAIWAYNHSARYVTAVLTLTAQYTADAASPSPATAGAALHAPAAG